MATIQKFLFETSFETPGGFEPLAESEPALEVAVEAEPEAPPPPSYSEADLEQARGEARQAGWDEGYQTAAREAETELNQTLSAFAAQLEPLREQIVAAEAQRYCDSVNLACVLLRKLFPHLTARHGQDEIEALVGDCLEHLREEPRLVLRVADAVLDQVRTRIESLAAGSGFEGKIVFLGAADMDAGDVRLEWADGGAERDSSRQWQEIDEKIAHALEAGTGNAPATATPPTGSEYQAEAERQALDAGHVPADPTQDCDPMEEATGDIIPSDPLCAESHTPGGLS